MKASKKELFENFKETGEHICPYCLRSDFDCVDALAEHVQVDHQVELEDTTEELGKLGLENKEVLDSWEKEQKLKILSEAYEKEPEKFRLYQKDDIALDKAVRDKLFKEALSVAGRGLNTLDAMFMRSMPISETGQCPDGYCLVDFSGEKRCVPQSALNAYNQYKAEQYDKAGSHQVDPQSGQSEQTIPMPESPEAKKILEKEYPVNKVSFRSGRLVLEPMSKDSIEQLSDKDKSLMILYSLLRKKKSN
jgi:uncharacterized Zn finger protein (UPF0148 family)